MIFEIVRRTSFRQGGSALAYAMFAPVLNGKIQLILQHGVMMLDQALLGRDPYHHSLIFLVQMKLGI